MFKEKEHVVTPLADLGALAQAAPALLRKFVKIADEHGVTTALFVDVRPETLELAYWLRRELMLLVGVTADESIEEHLRSSGLDVTEARWPVRVEYEYDLVLVCHTTPRDPYGLDGYREYLTRAWSAVAPGGVLVVVAENRGIGEFAKLLIKSGLEDDRGEERRRKDFLASDRAFDLLEQYPLESGFPLRHQVLVVEKPPA